MAGVGLQHALPLPGFETAKAAAARENSALFGGFDCVYGGGDGNTNESNVGSSENDNDDDDDDSLFGGGGGGDDDDDDDNGGNSDSDMASLFGGSIDGNDDIDSLSPPQPPPSPPFALPLPLPPTAALFPLALPTAGPDVLQRSSGFCDPRGKPGQDGATGVKEAEGGGARGRRTGGGPQDPLCQPQQAIDTPFSRAVGRAGHGDQVGHGRPCRVDGGSGSSSSGSGSSLAGAVVVDDHRAARPVNNDDDDDDVVVIAERSLPNRSGSVAAAAWAHHRELRPRCPQRPPPARIDLGTCDVEELLPHVQLDASLSLQALYKLLDLNQDAGKRVTAICRRHLANPAHTIVLSGSCEPGALRVLKVTLILSALALVASGPHGSGVGERYFGPDAAVQPRSRHVWPDDSTTLVLLFIQLLYRVTRNNSTRDRQRRKQAMALQKVGDAVVNRKRPAPPQRAAPSPPFFPPQPPNLVYSSPMCLREDLIMSKACVASKPLATPPATPSATPSPPVVPQPVFSYHGALRNTGYSCVVRVCAARGRPMASVATVPLHGLETLADDAGWDRTVQRVHDSSPTRHVLVYVQS
ncbi:hypothetical protein SPI_09271 [Niveomyces insectorum RCEF 264]|uniref:Uncharacterized protein n=1 Tax=Niveomyces insectorum RCEF 264 TaxID=1081102 RepID=A0A167M2C4_9HYPO|nr:hypothetical protein SPI_09271 [Niveomyces insectorum RCEF 264]